MRLTEPEKKYILSKYDHNTSNELLNHLKRVFPVSEYKLDWLDSPIKFILVSDKTHQIIGNKKYLVNKISDILENDWVHLGLPVIRRTVKKYIDGFK